MKRLVVNADDFGADEGRNEGIFEALQAGVVTSLSILPNGPASKEGLEGLRRLTRREVSIGVHLNLSEGQPLSKPSPKLLTGEEGNFLGKAQTHQLLMQAGNPRLEMEIEREMAAQLEALLQAGVRISHLDGHQHVHVFPAARRALCRMVREFTIPWVRIPEEAPFPLGSLSIPKDLIDEAQAFSRMAKEAREVLRETGARAVDHFRGLYLKGVLKLSLLIQTIEDLPDGLTELMVHPGRGMGRDESNPFSRFSTPDREEELHALLHPDFRQALKHSAVRLIPFPEVGD